MRNIIKLLGRSIDPKQDFREVSPRALLFVKDVIEYIFRLAGFFVMLCLVFGLTLSSCTENTALVLLPFLLAHALFFYIAVTTLGIPVFLMISEIKHTKLRRTAGYVTVLLMLVLTYYSVENSPIFEILETYIGRFFPKAGEC